MAQLQASTVAGILTTTGNIGIGITNPTARLQATGVTSYNTGITAAGNTVNGVGLGLLNANGHDWYLISTGTGNGGGANNLGFYDATAGDYRVYFKGDGNVGINTTSPIQDLHVYAAGNGDGILIESDPAGTNRAPALKLYPKAASANERNWAISPYKDVEQSLSFASSNAKGGDPYSAGTTRMIIDGISGNVGIGTDSPGLKLSIVSSTAFQPVLRLQNTDVNGYTGAHLYSSAGTLVGHFGWANGTSNTLSDKMYFGTIANKPVVFTTNDAEKVRITETGNVGIGTNNPIYPLVLANRGSGALQNRQLAIGNTATGGTFMFLGTSATTSGYGLIQHISVEGTSYGNLALQPEGANVGIGITTPAAKLEVNGNIKLSSTAGSTATPSNIWLGNDYSNGTTRDKLKVYLYNSGTEQYGFSVGSASDVQYHSNILHDFYVANSLKVRINGEGNVGIGTATPIAKFHVNNSGGTGNPFYVNTGNTGNTTLFEHTGASTPVPFTLTKSGFSGAALNYGLLYLYMNDSTAGNGSNLYFVLNDSAGNQHEYGGLGATIRSNTNGVEQGDLFFMTSDNGTTRSEKMRIISNGNVGIGTISPPSRLTVNGASTGTVPLVDLLASGTGLYQRGVRILNKDMAANSSLMGYAVGRSDDTRNQAQMVFNFIGAGSTSNYLEFGLFAVDNVLNIAGTGNVGIGITNPSYKLEVSGEVGIIYTNAIQTINGGSGYGLSRMYGNSSTVEMQIDAHSSNAGAGTIGTFTNSDVYIKTNNTSKIAIKAGGNVGINTTTPDGTLHIDSGTSGATAYALRTDAASLDYALYVSASGNVGIGGLVPAAQLNHKLVVFSGSIALRGPNDSAFSYRLNDTAGTNRNALYVSSSNYLNVGNAAFAGLQLFHTGSFSEANKANGENGVRNIYGNITDNDVLGTPDKWLAVRINNVNYVMPMYEV